MPYIDLITNIKENYISELIIIIIIYFLIRDLGNDRGFIDEMGNKPSINRILSVEPIKIDDIKIKNIDLHEEKYINIAPKLLRLHELNESVGKKYSKTLNHNSEKELKNFIHEKVSNVRNELEITLRKMESSTNESIEKLLTKNICDIIQTFCDNAATNNAIWENLMVYHMTEMSGLSILGMIGETGDKFPRVDPRIKSLGNPSDIVNIVDKFTAAKCFNGKLLPEDLEKFTKVKNIVMEICPSLDLDNPITSDNIKIIRSKLK